MDLEQTGIITVSIRTVVVTVRITSTTITPRSITTPPRTYLCNNYFNQQNNASELKSQCMSCHYPSGFIMVAALPLYLLYVCHVSAFTAYFR